MGGGFWGFGGRFYFEVGVGDFLKEVVFLGDVRGFCSGGE